MSDDQPNEAVAFSKQFSEIANRVTGDDNSYEETSSDEESEPGDSVSALPQYSDAPVEGSSYKSSNGIFLTKRANSSKLVVRPGIEQELRQKDRRLTYRFLSSSQFYQNRIFKRSSHMADVFKDVVTHSDSEDGAIKTADFSSVVQKAGLKMNSEVTGNVSKLTDKLQKAHGSELSMMQVVRYMSRIQKICIEKVNKMKYRKRLTRLVFLGGSCNPTTWRQDLLMPLLETRNFSYFNPQVADWTPACVYEEAVAKNEATVLFFVIDNQTRALASMIEVVENICAGRVFVLVVKDVELGFTITGKTVDEHEARELNLARAYLADIASRYGLLVFNDITFAAHYTIDFVIPKIKDAKHKDGKIKHRHSSAYSTRAAYGNIAQQQKNIFNDSVFYTNRLVSCSCPFSVHDVLEQALKESDSHVITPEVIYSCLRQHGMEVTPELTEATKRQLERTTDEHEVVLFMEELVRDHLSEAKDQTNNTVHYDVYLGGSCNKYSTWRADIAIPVFEKLGVRYFDPGTLDWTGNHAFDELRAKSASLIVMYVVDPNSRGLATMIDAVEMILAQEQRIVLVVEDVDHSKNPTIDPKECKDLNRARAYLADVATRHDLLVYSSVQHAVEYAAEKVALLRKFSGENERWNTLSTAELEPTIELQEADVLGKADNHVEPSDDLVLDSCSDDGQEKPTGEHERSKYSDGPEGKSDTVGESKTEDHYAVRESKTEDHHAVASAASTSVADPVATAATKAEKDSASASCTCAIM